jgi:hypothetical protein
MRNYLALLSLFALAACSSGVDKKYFETEGVQQPTNSFCPAPPSSFGQAEKIQDFSEGNGCGVSNAYRVSRAVWQTHLTAGSKTRFNPVPKKIMVNGLLR